MAYLGRGLDKISNIEVLDNITFDGSSSYSITKGSVAFTPNSAQSCLISIDGVVQATNFTVSSSTINFGVAVPSTSTCNFFLHYGTGVMTVPSDGSVTTAKLGNSAVDLTSKVTGALPVANGGTALTSGFVNGFSGMADQWRLTSNFSSDNTPITANLERNDSTGFNYLGSGMSQSSGIFTFPETGYYLVSFHTEHFINGVDREINGRIGVTTNNSSYSDVARGATFVKGVGANTHTSTDCSTIVDVTDTSNVKVRFGVVTDQSSTTTISDTNANVTFMTFIRLGDT